MQGPSRVLSQLSYAEAKLGNSRAIGVLIAVGSRTGDAG
jgi:hypothetical protein